MRVLATARHFLIDPAPRELLAQEGVELISCAYGDARDDSRIGEEEMISLLARAEGVIPGNARLGRRVIEASPRLRVISIRGVGFDGVDLEAATRRGIKVTITPGTIDHAVADISIGLLLALSRGVLTADRRLRQGNWETCVGTEFYGKTLGLLGLGRIGKTVARRAAGGFDMRVLAIRRNPRRDPEFVKRWNIRLVDLKTLLRESDFVSIHLPLEAGTRGLLGARELGWMKPGAFLVNTARGPIIDENALYRILQEGRLGGAALDVFEQEPLGDSPLRDLGNVILTPHMAGYSREAIVRGNTLAARNAVAVLKGAEIAAALAVN